MNKKFIYYIYNPEDNSVRGTNDLTEYAKMYETNKRRIAQDIIEEVSISTVFLGIDHSFGENSPPLVFETMIFGGEHDQYTDRYSTWIEAKLGHDKAVNLVINSKNNDKANTTDGRTTKKS